ncbi:MAG TPA: biopolymer transporter ExbD [Trinickia sp.]|jgi:biopolymer transport protein ExbD|uniref:ExbD/TolR family protein n=1 Tax=Trinickia sp. TaxID=2571163 RepID=UPI002C9DF05B|nr:biopolymer transporter ExbD [Trinickia sp.]HTI18482.1 biopolymer transporter ExbD [Trinickia sp.]
MGMNVSSGGSSSEPEVMADINTTPLIDVMLVLLIMLIITIPIQMHAVKMNLPVGNPPPPATPPQVVQIDIDFDGTITWNGTAVPDQATLEHKLHDAATQPVQPEIHLFPNKLAPYKVVAEVMAAAEREGETQIGLVGNEQYMQ